RERGRGDTVPGLPAGAGGEGRNPVCPRPAPAWQKGIGEFLRLAEKENREPGGEAAGSSGLEPAPTKAPPLPPDPAEDGESSEEEQT
uniref:PCNA-associated factor n=1 Tax=Calidris pygmaea TaxID=425635 RepID=A0A8C3JAW4_9CHAR